MDKPLTKAERQALHKAVTTSNRNIPVRNANGFRTSWRRLVEELNLKQHVKGNYLELSPAVQQKIKQDCANRNWDISHDYSQLDRIQAAQAGDDKAAGKKPNDDYIVVKSLKGELHFSSHCIMLPARDSLRCRYDSLKLEHYASVLLVENLVCFDQIHAYALPELPLPCLVAYRGDYQHSPKGISQLLTRLPKDSLVVAFTDADPAGLRIASTTHRVSAAIFPALNSALPTAQQSAKFKADYQKQYQAQQFLEANPQRLGQWATVWQQVRQAKTSVLQELMLALNCELRLHHKDALP